MLSLSSESLKHFYKKGCFKGANKSVTACKTYTTSFSTIKSSLVVDSCAFERRQQQMMCYRTVISEINCS